MAAILVASAASRLAASCLASGADFDVTVKPDFALARGPAREREEPAEIPPPAAEPDAPSVPLPFRAFLRRTA